MSLAYVVNDVLNDIPNMISCINDFTNDRQLNIKLFKAVCECVEKHKDRLSKDVIDDVKAKLTIFKGKLNMNELNTFNIDYYINSL